MRILVTGSAGFMGSHLVDYLILNGHVVCGIDNLSGGYKENINPKSHFFKLDLRNKNALMAVLRRFKPQLIYHLAADATEGRSQFTPLFSTENNLIASLNLLIAAVKVNAKKIVITSSMSVYGDQKPPFTEDMPAKPIDIYGVAKASVENITRILSQVYGFKYTILRPHNVYGPRQNLADPYRNVIAIFINRLLQGKNFYIYGDGSNIRSFSYIDDITPPLAKAGFITKANSQIINLGPSTKTTINQLSKYVLKHFVQDINKIPKSLRPVYLPSRPQEVHHAYCSDDKARLILDFNERVSLEAGIEKMIEWAKMKGPQKFKYRKLELENKNLPATWKQKKI